MRDDSDFILKTLKLLDPARYFAALYLSENIRSDIATIWVCDAEIQRIPLLVSEPLPGEIRLQWWRDVIKSGGKFASSPLADALVDVIKRRELPDKVFDTYLEARIFDLYQDPMPNMGTLEGYLGETSSATFLMSAMCAGEEQSPLLADACGHAGMAYGLTRVLASIARTQANKQVYMPLDKLAKHGLDHNSWLYQEFDERHLSVIKEFAGLAMYYQQQAVENIAKLSAQTQSVFLMLAYVAPLLTKIHKASFNIAKQPIYLSPLRRQWTMFQAARRKS